MKLGEQVWVKKTLANARSVTRHAELESQEGLLASQVIFAFQRDTLGASA